jgi:hypothetical protein
MLKLFYPEFFASIEALEAEAEAAGLQWCRWGGYDRNGNRATDTKRQAVGLLCESCDSRQHAPALPRIRPARRPACKAVQGAGAASRRGGLPSAPLPMLPASWARPGERS